MLPVNPQEDPIVEILRLAYLRGLALRQEQEKSKAGNVPFPTENRTVIKREGSPASEPKLDPSNRNGKEGLSIS